MKNKCKFSQLKRLNRQSLIELLCFLKELKQKELFKPILYKEKDSTDWIQQWNSCGVHETNKQNTESVCRFFTDFNLGTRVKLIQVMLPDLLSVGNVHVLFCLVLVTINQLYAFLASTISKLFVFANHIFRKIRSLRTKHLYHDGKANWRAVSCIPIGVKHKVLAEILISEADDDADIDEGLEKDKVEDRRVFLSLVEMLFVFAWPNED